MSDDLLRPSDVARQLGVPRSWLHAAAKDGRIPSIRLGGAEGPLRFVKADLDAWLEEARRGWTPAETPRTTSQRPTGTVRKSGSAPDASGAQTTLAV
ncbi:MAG TPA: helix-turn-helix domain-containing protein [Solirubrobacteraceae bacterium]|jgi:excisionase family DNA binding protein